MTPRPEFLVCYLRGKLVTALPTRSSEARWCFGEGLLCRCRGATREQDMPVCRQRKCTTASGRIESSPLVDQGAFDKITFGAADGMASPLLSNGLQIKISPLLPPERSIGRWFRHTLLGGRC